MNVVTNLGLDLPVIDPGVHLVDHDSLQTYSRVKGEGDQASTILRHARLTGVVGFGLKQCLEKAEDEFKRLEDRTGAPTVEHTWALYPADAVPWTKYYQNKPDRRIPRGYILAAEVERVIAAPGERPEDGYKNLESALRSYRRTSPLGRVRLWDMRTNFADKQYVFGRKMKDDTARAQYFMVDIEPLLARWPKKQLI
jgi:hypothetical protein